MRSQWQTNTVTHTDAYVIDVNSLLKKFVYLFRFNWLCVHLHGDRSCWSYYYEFGCRFFYSSLVFNFVGGHFSLGCSFHMCDIYFIRVVVFCVRQSQRSIEKSLYRSFSICCGCVIEKLNETVFVVAVVVVFILSFAHRIFVSGRSSRHRKKKRPNLYGHELHNKQNLDLLFALSKFKQLRVVAQWARLRSFLMQCNLIIAVRLWCRYSRITFNNERLFIHNVYLCDVESVVAVSSDIFEWAGSSMRQSHGNVQRDTRRQREPTTKIQF